MKHIKNFEKFELNELRGADAYRAYTKASSFDSDDELNSEIKTRQANKFEKYINPEIEKYANKLGFNLKKDDLFNYVVLIDKKHVANIDADTGEVYNFDKNKGETSFLRKLKRLSYKIKKDHEAVNEL